MATQSKIVMDNIAEEATQWLEKFLSDVNTVATFGKSQDRLKISDAPSVATTRQTD